jgi:hypothetical protein
MKPANFYSLKQEIDELSLDPASKTGLRLCFFLIGLELILLAVFWHRLPPQVPLFYSRAYGEARLVNNWWLWLVPVTTFLIQLVSIRLAVKTKPEDHIWAQMLAWLGTILAAMGLATLGKIIGIMV